MFLIVDEYPSNSASPRGLLGCFICGAPKRVEDILVDLGVNVDEVLGLDGEVYGLKKPIMCSQCIEELGSLVGMMSAHRSTQLLNAEVQMTARIVELERIAQDYDDLKTQLAKVKVA